MPQVASHALALLNVLVLASVQPIVHGLLQQHGAAKDFYAEPKGFLLRNPGKSLGAPLEESPAASLWARPTKESSSNRSSSLSISPSDAGTISTVALSGSEAESRLKATPFIFEYRTLFSVKQWYELAWLIGILFLVVLTSVYGSFRVRPELVEKHRQPLGQIGLAEGDGGMAEMYQRGYIESLFGRVLFLAWGLLPTFGYTQLTFFTVDEYLLAWHSPDLSWIQLAEPFLLVFAVSHLVLYLQCQYLAEARVYFMMPCPLAEATKVLVENPQDFSANVLTDVCIDQSSGARYFEYTCVRYLWQAASFTPVGIDEALDSAEAVRRVKAGGLSAEEVRRRAVAGPNVINVQVPNVFGSLAQEFLDPIYCFQFACIWLYMFYTTWNIAFIWLAMVVSAGLVKSLLIVRRNQLKIRELARTEGSATILRAGQWQKLPSGEIVPGDIVRIDEGEVCCDVAVVDGGVVVNESMLTGEPMPVQRFPLDPTSAGQLTPATHKKHFLFAGTIVMQSAGPQEHRGVGVAVATGARTAKGDLVRMVLFPSPTSFKFTDQLRQVYAIMFLYVCVLFCVVLTTDQGHWIISIFSGLCILAQALNPNLPVSLAIAQTVSANRLNRTLGVKCLAPQRLPMAGKVHVMVMDKTGTITKEGMDFAGVRPVRCEGSKPVAAFRDLCSSHTASGCINVNRNDLAEEVKWALAACHTVTKLRDGTLVGNMVECSMLKASGWELADDSTTVSCISTGQRLELLKALDFDHHRMTSGQVVRSGARTVVFVKGSYEAIEALSLPASVPKNYKEVTELYAKEQYYVLAVGMKELGDAATLSVMGEGSDRNSLENGLTLLGLLLFRNEVKPDSPEVMAQLAEGGVRRVICTGDNALTGAAVGERCNLMGRNSGSRVILGEKGDTAKQIRWLQLADGTTLSHEEVLQSKEEEVDLVVTRDAFATLLETGDLDLLLKHIRVYARMKPTDKVKVIQRHQEAGWIVGMCGDGGNDCGGLRAAHIGLALSEAEASIVAPFSSSAEYGTGSKSLMAVVHLIRHGRATLTANLATYSYFMVYGLTLPSSKMTVVFLNNTMLPEWHWLFIDIILGAFMVASMTLSWPSDRLACRRPTAALLGFRTFFSVIMHVLIFFTFYGMSMYFLVNSDFFIAIDPVKDLDLPSHEWGKKGDNYHCAVTFLCLACQLATAGYCYSFGGEHRKSILQNGWLTFIYALVLLTLFTLTLGGPSELHCVFRVNCDQVTSKTMYVPFLQELSTGNLGGCFLGPQFKAWKEELGPDFNFPDKETNQCMPASTFDPEKELEIQSGAFFWGAAQCLGANNCFPSEFRKLMAGLLAAQVVLSFAAQQLVMMCHPGSRQHFKKL